jgi:UDP-GlcNAc:undecaprenyl-phosphate/decaprenyl-phosphate GlcNAc-1-phosphate transferase
MKFAIEEHVVLLLLCVFLLAFAVSTVLTPQARNAALKFNACAATNHRTIHKGRVPKLGGIGIFVALLAATLLIPLLTGKEYLALEKELAAFYIGGAIILAFGICDDYKGISSYQKLLGQLIAAMVIVLFGYRVTLLANPFGPAIALGIFSIPFTILWIVSICNAINLIDGLDGLATGISLGAALMMVVISLWFGNLASAFPSAILAGALIGFLLYNFSPAKIFLGDSGSLLIGFLLACFSINGTFRTSQGIALYVPMVILGIPILDTLLAIIRRVKKGLSPFQADNKHLHHRLLQLGFGHKQTAIFLNGISYSWGIIAFLLIILDTHYFPFLLSLILVMIFIGLGMLGYNEYLLARIPPPAWESYHPTE